MSDSSLILYIYLFIFANNPSANHYFILGGSVPGLITSKALNLTEYLTNFLMLMKEYNSFINPTSDTLSSKAKMTGAVVQVGRRLFKSRTKHINGANNPSNLLGRNLSSSNLLADSESPNYVSNFNGSSATTMLKSPSSSSETSNLSIHPLSSTISNNSNQGSSQSQLPITSHSASLSISSSSSSSSASSGTTSLSGSSFGLRSRPSSVIATATSFSSLKTAASNGFGRHRLDKSNRESLTSLGSSKNASNLTINESGTFHANSSSTSIGSPIPTLSGTAGSQIVNSMIPTSNGQILTKEFSHLTIYHMPFSPDMYETFQTLCEVLIEAYRKIYSFLSLPPPLSLISEETYSNYFSTNPNEVPHNFSSTNSFLKTNGASHDSYDLLLKIDEHIKKFIISPSVRGIDMMSKSLIYEETKKLENILIHTK